MIHYSASFHQIKNDFIKNGIDISYPGFYDEPEFLRIEQYQRQYQNNYLSNYARFVQKQHYDKKYINDARKKITCIVNALYEEFSQDSHLSACVNISMLLSRILEKEGIWNYIVEGALTIEFLPALSLQTMHYWPIDEGNFVAAHAWVCAPPYNIIDLTIYHQPFKNGETKYLPKIIMQENITPFEVENSDIFSPKAEMYFVNIEHIRPDYLLRKVAGELVDFYTTFSPNSINYNGTTLKYIPTGTNAPEESLEKMYNIKIKGKLPNDVYKFVIKPALSKLL